jgi:hypothetical protein
MGLMGATSATRLENGGMVDLPPSREHMVARTVQI